MQRWGFGIHKLRSVIENVVKSLSQSKDLCSSRRIHIALYFILSITINLFPKLPQWTMSSTSASPSQIQIPRLLMTLMHPLIGKLTTQSRPKQVVKLPRAGPYSVLVQASSLHIDAFGVESTLLRPSCLGAYGSQEQSEILSQLRLHFEKNIQDFNKSTKYFISICRRLSLSPRLNYAKDINLVLLIVYTNVRIVLTYLCQSPSNNSWWSFRCELRCPVEVGS